MANGPTSCYWTSTARVLMEQRPLRRSCTCTKICLPWRFCLLHLCGECLTICVPYWNEPKKIGKKMLFEISCFFLVWGCSLLNLKDVFVCVGSCSFYPEACAGRGSNWGAAKNTAVTLSPTNAIKQQSTVKITNSATEKWTHTHTHARTHTHINKISKTHK